MELFCFKNALASSACRLPLSSRLCCDLPLFDVFLELLCMVMFPSSYRPRSSLDISNFQWWSASSVMLFVLPLLYVFAVVLFGSNESLKLGNSLRVTFSSLLETTFVFPNKLGSCSWTRTTLESPPLPSLFFSPPTLPPAMTFVPHCDVDWIGFFIWFYLSYSVYMYLYFWNVKIL